MNISMVIYVLGWILTAEAAMMILPLIAGIFYNEEAVWSFVITIAICLFLGISMVLRGPKNRVFHVREGFLSVALSWILLSIFGALPFVISGSIPSFVDAVFETVSGFTTTGASILPDVESLPRCIIFWRSFTHWIGGMGVLVFILAILPMAGGSHMSLMKAESPGPVVSKLVPTVQSTAKILYGIYIAMTILLICLLLAGGMPLFDSLTLSFGTAGTGGFGIKNDSIGGYSSYLQNVITIFMILFGVNFSMYFLILQRKLKQAFTMEEVRAYFIIIIVSIGIITFRISGSYESILESLKHAAFQVGSIITTTGYSTTDFNQWDEVSRTILVLLMLIGACAGSTGGGIKVSRILMAIKMVLREIIFFIHPRTVKRLSMDGKPIEHDTLRTTYAYYMAYILILACSVFLLAFDGHDLITNFTAVAATFNNIGPGLEMVGPTQNFGFYSDFSKIVMIFDMLAGRLEIFPLLLIFSPEAWKKF